MPSFCILFGHAVGCSSTGYWPQHPTPWTTKVLFQILARGCAVVWLLCAFSAQAQKCTWRRGLNSHPPPPSATAATRGPAAKVVPARPKPGTREKVPSRAWHGYSSEQHCSRGGPWGSRCRVSRSFSNPLPPSGPAPPLLPGQLAPSYAQPGRMYLSTGEKQLFGIFF